MDIFDKIGGTLSSLWDQIYEILPKSPIVYIESNPQVKEILGYLNWFIPIEMMISITESWLTVIVIYYILQIILRWIKVIE